MTRRIDVRVLTPFGAASGMGNWRTAQRYAQMLRSSGISASIFEPHQIDDACMPTGGRTVAIVLNAARSSASIERFVQAGLPVMTVLTGTDLYGQLSISNQASPGYQRTEKAIQQSDLILTLQPAAREEVMRRWPELSSRVYCLLQNAAPRAQHAPSVSLKSKTIRFLIAAHIRPEKDPVTAFLAFQRAFPEGWAQRDDGGRVPVRLIHVGGHKDRMLADELIRLGTQDSGILLEGPLTHAETLRLMTHVHALIQPSISEGGALVVPEAIACGLPVIASDIPAHRGQLGAGYSGLFEPRNIEALAQVMRAFIADAGFRQMLAQETAALGPVLASPAHERSELVKLVRELADYLPKEMHA